MKPFFSYYGSKYRLSKNGFYPSPAHGNIIIEPFAGSACYSVYHEPETAILIDSYDEIAGIWRYLINATPSDIMQLPDVIVDIKELNTLPAGASSLIAFWLHKVAYSPAKIIPAGYEKYKNPSTCHIWGAAVKTRIANQVEKIKGWEIHCQDYTHVDDYAPDKKKTWFIDPPYSGSAGRKYKHSKIDYEALGAWLQKKTDSQIIACENQDLTCRWADFNQSYNALSMRGKKVELMWTQDVCAWYPTGHGGINMTDENTDSVIDSKGVEQCVYCGDVIPEKEV